MENIIENLRHGDALPITSKEYFSMSSDELLIEPGDSDRKFDTVEEKLISRQGIYVDYYDIEDDGEMVEYREYLARLDGSDNKVKHLIVTINLRVAVVVDYKPWLN